MIVYCIFDGCAAYVKCFRFVLRGMLKPLLAINEHIMEQTKLILFNLQTINLITVGINDSEF